MPDFVDGAAENQIADQPVTVAGHGDEIAVFSLGGLQNFFWRIAQCEKRCYRQSLRAKLCRNFLEVGAVGFHLFGLGKLELVEIASHPAVGHVEEQHLRAQTPGHFRDMRDNGFIRRAVFEGNQNFSVHKFGACFLMRD
jgi:hypothetical protein